MRYASRHTDSDFQQVISSDEEYRHYDATIVHTDNFLKLLNKYSDMNTLFIYLIMVKSSIKGMDFLVLMQEAMKFLSSYGLTIQNLLLDLKKLLPDIL